MVRGLPGRPTVDLRARWLALVYVGERLRLESRVVSRRPGDRHASRHPVVSISGPNQKCVASRVSCPRRKSVASCAGSLRRTGTDEEDLLTEELACSSSLARSVNESWCRTASWHSQIESNLTTERPFMNDDDGATRKR